MDLSGVLTKENLSIRKIIALCLVLVSFVALLFPWITMSVKVMGNEYTMQDLMSLASGQGMTQEELEADFEEYLTDAAQELAGQGYKVDVDKVMKLLHLLLEGKISPLDFAIVSADLSKVLGDLEDAMNNSPDAYDMLVYITQIENIKESVTIVAVAMWAVLILMVAGAVFAVYSLLTDKKYGVIAYAGAAAVAFFAFVIATNKLNDASLMMFSGILDLLEDLGILSGAVTDLDFFHLSAAPFVCLIAGIAAVITEKVTAFDDRIPARGTSFTDGQLFADVSPRDRWVCSCGTTITGDSQFCHACGQKRQTKKVCSCGAELIPGAAFCSACGRKQGDPITSVTTQAPEVKPVTKPEAYTKPVAQPVPDTTSKKSNDPFQDMGDLI